MIDNLALTELLPLNTGFEGTPVRLSAISAALAEQDGSETLKVTIGGLPAGAILTDSNQRFTATTGNTVADVTGWNLANLSLLPPANGNGSIALQVTATAIEQANGQQASTTQTLTLKVLPVNDAPDAVNVSYTVPPSGSLVIDFAKLVRDIDSSNLVVTADRPHWGTFSRNADGTYTYRPFWGYVGSDKIRYSVSDDKYSTSAEISLNVAVTPGSSASIVVQSSSGASTAAVAEGIALNWGLDVTAGIDAFKLPSYRDNAAWVAELTGSAAASPPDLALTTGLVVQVQ